MRLMLGGLLATAVLCASVATEVMASQREVLRYFSTATVQPLVDYCLAQAPERSDSVLRGFDNYVMRLDDALRGRHPGAGIPDTLTAELRTEAQAAGVRLVQSIRHIDAGTYCGWLASRLQLTTREMLVESLDLLDRQMEGQAAPAPKPGR